MESENPEKILIVGVMIIIACILLFAILFLKSHGGTENGYLQGIVTIGPLCPVEPCHISEGQRAAAYPARHMAIFSTGFSGLVPEAGFPPDGYYRIALPAGGYDVSLPMDGIDHSPELPRHIVVRPEENTFPNISIDNGIR